MAEKISEKKKPVVHVESNLENRKSNTAKINHRYETNENWRRNGSEMAMAKYQCGVNKWRRQLRK